MANKILAGLSFVDWDPDMARDCKVPARAEVKLFLGCALGEC